MVALNDIVRIKSEDITGTIVDVSCRNGTIYYVVESSTRGAIEGRDGGDWPLYDCKREDIEIVSQGGRKRIK